MQGKCSLYLTTELDQQFQCLYLCLTFSLCLFSLAPSISFTPMGGAFAGFGGPGQSGALGVVLWGF